MQDAMIKPITTSTSSAPSESSRRSMPATLDASTRHRNPRQPARWAIEASRLVGYRPMTCEKRVQLGVHEKVGEYVRSARLFGAPEIAVKLAKPVMDALNVGPVLPLDEALRKAQRADALEEIAETAFLTDPSPENRKNLIDATRQQIATSWELLRSLEAGDA